MCSKRGKPKCKHLTSHLESIIKASRKAEEQISNITVQELLVTVFNKQMLVIATVLLFMINLEFTDIITISNFPF